MIFKNRRAQNIMEYAIIIALVTAALIAMQLYMRRGLQGRIHDMSRQVSPYQYVPGEGATESDYVVETKQKAEESESRAP
jgi:Flp pilus assembly pilin Flp